MLKWEDDYPILELDSFREWSQHLANSHAPVMERATSLLEKTVAGQQADRPTRKLDRPALGRCSCRRGLEGWRNLQGLVNPGGPGVEAGSRI